MAIRGLYESTLSTSEVFQVVNNLNPSKKTQDRAVDLIKNSKHLTNEDIEAAYISVRQISDSLTREAMRAFDEERTVLIYNNVPKLSITQALPFLTFKTAKGYVTYVFVDKYIAVTRDGVLRIEPSILRDLLIGALIANGIKRNYMTLASNQYLQKICMEMYTEFFFRIINREFSIAADKIIFETIKYWVNKFFLTVVFNAADSPENIEHLARSHIKYIDEIKMEQIASEYTNANPTKVSDVLNMLQLLTPRMKTANFKTFLSDWINYYYTPAMLAVDNIEYLIFMCLTLLSGNNIINISASDVVKEAKNIKSFKSELLKLI